jgi:para-aminobenzoate synthetase / 4-amino-4-deoxychorismate lyase
MNDSVVILRTEQDGWLRFEQPVHVCSTRRLEDVQATLDEVQDGLDRGLHAAGFLTYEAAAGLDSALCAHDPGPLPLVWFGLYRAALRPAPWPASEAPFTVGAWEPAVSRAQYEAAVTRIREYIRGGDTYQVNYTYRLRTAFRGSDWSFFLALLSAQKQSRAAFVRLPDYSLCSVSPELFFALDGRRALARPMKGTAARGMTWQDDQHRRRELHASEKNRAENVMITDMIRNDLGRIAEPGSVRVRDAFTVERYPTVWQMTSTVTAQTAATLPQMMRALFPCASVTGAPKVRTMQIVRELETAPRGIYTGAIGYWSPGSPDGPPGRRRKAEFNVAIRTVMLDRARARAEYGVGGGIVWDSDPQGEYEECLTKARVLTCATPPFFLLETLRWTPENGFFLLDGHLRRLARSAAYFGFPCDPAAVRGQLETADFTRNRAPLRVRLTLAEDGAVATQTEAAPAFNAETPWRVAFAARPIDDRSPFFYHKTTWRDAYRTARESAPPCDDVVLHNDRGEVTETTVANLVFEFAGRKVTPPTECGLLSGTMREHLLARGAIATQRITLEQARRADAVFAVNSVRGWIPLRIVPSE